MQVPQPIAVFFPQQPFVVQNGLKTFLSSKRIPKRQQKVVNRFWTLKVPKSKSRQKLCSVICCVICQQISQMSRGEAPYTLPPEKIVPSPSGMEISLFPPIPSIVFSILSRFPAEAKFHLCVWGRLELGAKVTTITMEWSHCKVNLTFFRPWSLL